MELLKRSAEKLLEEQLMFQTLLSEVSAGFINLPSEQIDEGILDSQRRVCEFSGVDLSALWQLSVEDPEFIYQTHVYRPLGGPPVPERMEAKEYFPRN